MRNQLRIDNVALQLAHFISQCFYVVPVTNTRRKRLKFNLPSILQGDLSVKN